MKIVYKMLLYIVGQESPLVSLWSTKKQAIEKIDQIRNDERIISIGIVKYAEQNDGEIRKQGEIEWQKKPMLK